MNYNDIIGEIKKEREELDGKISTLAAILEEGSKVLVFIDEDEKQLLLTQNTIMAAHSNILGARILMYKSKTTYKYNDNFDMAEERDK